MRPDLSAYLQCYIYTPSPSKSHWIRLYSPAEIHNEQQKTNIQRLIWWFLSYTKTTPPQKKNNSNISNPLIKNPKHNISNQPTRKKTFRSKMVKHLPVQPTQKLDASGRVITQIYPMYT